VVDWIKAVIPCAHIEEVCGGDIVSFDALTGEEEWRTKKRKSVEGSYSSKVPVKTPDLGFLLVDGNPSKFLQGHNIFGSDDLVGLCAAFFDGVCNRLKLSPTDEDRAAWAAAEFDLKRVDLAESFALARQEDVAAWLRAATVNVRGRSRSAEPTCETSPSCCRSSLRSTPCQPIARRAHAGARRPSAPTVPEPPGSTCLLCSSLHPLKDWSLRESRGGSLFGTVARARAPAWLKPYGTQQTHTPAQS